MPPATNAGIPGMLAIAPCGPGACESKNNSFNSVRDLNASGVSPVCSPKRFGPVGATSLEYGVELVDNETFNFHNRLRQRIPAILLGGATAKSPWSRFKQI